MGKILTFIGGCLTGVLGVFAVAVMSELSSPTQTPVTSEEDAEDESKVLPDDEEKQVVNI